MPQILTMAGRPAAQPITLDIGGAMPLKLIPVAGERLPFSLAVAPPALATVEALNNRTSPNFTTFTLRGTAAGTDAGLLARLFLAESPGSTSDRSDYLAATSAEASRLMRVVLEDRLARPSARWASAGARSLGDVVRARGQFEGFGGYPAPSAAVTQRINNVVAIANDAGDARQPAARAHIEQAIRIASGRRPTDPTTTGLFWWKTRGSAAPGTGVVLYRTVLDNSFYREGN